MLRYEVGAAELGAVRFGISPLSEMTRSLRALISPDRFPLLRSWVRYASAARRPLDISLLIALVNDRLWTPDFLTPRPERPLERIADELERLRGMDPDVFLHQLEATHGSIPPLLRGEPDRVVRDVAETFAAYWSTVMAPSWGWMRQVLEADVEFRGRSITQRGMVATLDRISPTMRCTGDAIETVGPFDRTERLHGEGITLVPSMFSRGVSIPIHADTPPVLFYAVRGQGATWDRFDPATPAALTDLLGTRRSQVLELLETPASSTQLADRLGISTPAVNQHLRALQRARLLTSLRRGRSVVYRRTPLGDDLLRGRPPERG